MIPQVGERKVRPCNDCIAYDNRNNSCKCGREEFHRRELYSRADLLSRYWMAPIAVPCIIHITPDEFVEIFESGIV